MMKQVKINNQLTPYYITEKGKLFNKATGRWYKGIVKQEYLVYDLRFNNKKYSRLAHRLVAENFIPNPDDLPIVNHKDGNKLNNQVSNLEWVTPSENLLHAYNTGLKKKFNNVDKREKYNGDLEDEVWKTYKNTTYMISNKGRARNLKTGNIMKGKIGTDGYLSWCFIIDKKKRSFLAHKVVYETFRGVIKDGYVINHIDGNKANCKLDNLEEITRSENVMHGIYQLNSNPNVRPVGKYSLEDELLQVYPSCAEAARQNIGCQSNNISRICNGKGKTHKGYIWKYINEE